jgi:hypothetical protein
VANAALLEDNAVMTPSTASESFLMLTTAVNVKATVTADHPNAASRVNARITLTASRARTSIQTMANLARVWPNLGEVNLLLPQ